ncbi:MAG: exonuclease SbcCD subunit D [Selenomonadaceae bacterium]|nr:exonuclease SbcCD subunit D [Selenomonadaceae bacterium]
MRLLHTADWHLGKTLKGVTLLEDQKYIIDQIFDIIAEKNIDAVIIAGDIYDRGIPPIDAVELFNETLNRFAEKNLPVLIIAGNHDSPTRLNFGSDFFARHNIFITSKISDDPKPIVLSDDFGEVYFSLIPFFEPVEIRAKFLNEDDKRLDYNEANKIYVDLSRKNIPEGKRSIAVAHVFLTGGIESNSERKFVGGSANVNANIFDGYNYTALGHLHFPHKISAENIRYGGSPLKYSFDEANQKKSVTIADINESGAVTVETIALKPRRDVRVLQGTIDELLRENPTEDYISAILTERVINPIDKLAYVFPNLLSVEFALNATETAEDDEIKARADGSMTDYFADFFETQTGEKLNDEYRAAMDKVFDELERKDREE